MPAWKRPTGTLLTLVMVALTLLDPEPGAAQAPRGTLTIGMATPIKTLDQGAGSIPEITLGENIFETLLNRKVDGSVEPNLATRWTVSEDARTWTFYLRKGVKFHNGEPFDAEAVKFSAEWIRDPNVFTQFKGYWAKLSGIEIPDPYTITFHFKEPYPHLAQVLPWHLPILPPKYVGANRKEWGSKPIGTGPYKFVEWIPNDRVVMEANPDYWAGAPPFQKLIFRPIPDETARTAALLSGEVDIVPLNLDQAPMVSAASGVHVVWTDTLQRERLQFRHDIKPFDNIKVRQAVAHAINQEAIIKNILPSTIDVVGPGSTLDWGFSPKVKDSYPYNPQRAKQLLAEAGYPNGFEVEYTYPIGSQPKIAETAQAIANDLAKVGIRVKLLPIEWPKFVDLQKNHQQTPLSQAFWTSGGNFHIWHPFVVLLHCKLSSALWNPKKPTPYWCNPEIDALADEAARVLAKDSEKAKAMYAVAQQKAVDYVYNVWLWQHKQPWGVSNKIMFTPAASFDIRMFHQARWTGQ